MKVVILSDRTEGEDLFVVCEAKRPYEYVCLFTKQEEAVLWCEKHNYEIVDDLEGII